MLCYIYALPGLDGIVLLSALFREAYFEFQLEHAQDARDALQTALQNLAYKLPEAMPQQLKDCICSLVDDRILNNIWILESDMPVTSEYLKASRVKQIRKFLSWYLSFTNPHRANSVSTHLIVPDSDRLQWFRRNKAECFKLWDSARVLSSDDFHEKIDELGLSQAELDRMHSHPDENSQINELMKRCEFNAPRDLQFRQELQRIERVPEPIKHQVFEVPPGIRPEELFVDRFREYPLPAFPKIETS